MVYRYEDAIMKTSDFRLKGRVFENSMCAEPFFLS